ncbi:MAG TPA: FG-GAP-like repeat-containing protein, partial [Planctomycetota bacterium]|nr:FG-GAP-like repeat-containing protein [Planctomycetota bacterium]
MRDSIPLLASALAFALTPSLFAQQDWFNTWNSPGGSTGDAFGYSVAEMGDLDSDGLSEVLVGAIGADNNGRNSGSVFILDGDTGNVLLRVDGEGAGDLLGVDVIGLDDLDGDGSKDFAAGSPYYEGANGFFSGRAYVFSGADGSVLDTIEGLAAGDMLGSALAFGDIDGDGIKELMVSAIGHGNM